MPEQGGSWQNLLEMWVTRAKKRAALGAARKVTAYRVEESYMSVRMAACRSPLLRSGNRRTRPGNQKVPAMDSGMPKWMSTRRSKA